MAETQTWISHIRFKHSNWGENAPICLIEPSNEPFKRHIYDLNEKEAKQYPWWNILWDNYDPASSLNLVVGLNGSGKTTLLKCIELACAENRPLIGKTLDAFCQQLAERGVDYFEIAVWYSAYFDETSGWNTFGPIIERFYKSELMTEFRADGNSGGDDEFGDWLYTGGRVEDIVHSWNNHLKLTWISKFDIKNNRIELEIIPELPNPGFNGFKIEKGKVVKTNLDESFHETVRLSSITFSDQAIYPTIEPVELYGKVKDELHGIGLNFDFEGEVEGKEHQYPPHYPRTHRIRSKAAFVVDEELHPGLEALQDKEDLTKSLHDMSGFEISKKFDIKKNEAALLDWSKPKSENSHELGLVLKEESVYCLRIPPYVEVEKPERGPWNTALQNDVTEPWIFDDETGTQFFEEYDGLFIFNSDKNLLIKYIKNRLLELKNSHEFVVERLFGLPREIILSLQVVKRLSSSYKFGGYLTDGQARLASLIHEIMTKPYDILLIDEPETSMHIDWQRRIVQEIIETSKFRLSEEGDWDAKYAQVYITTHSPDVILEHLDLVTELASKYEGVHHP